MRYRWLCRTPAAYCSGVTIVVASEGKEQSRKAHTNPEDVYTCYVNYLKKHADAIQAGPHQFIMSNGSVLCLPRPSQAGVRVRKGKGNVWILDEKIG